MKSCLRYYCWNNELTDEVLPGCSQSFDQPEAFGFSDPIFGIDPKSGSGIGVASKIGKSGTTIVLPTRYKDKDVLKKSGIVLNDELTKFDDRKKPETTSKKEPKPMFEVVKEDNGVITKHLPEDSVELLTAAAASFPAFAGYTEAEWPIVKRDGPMGLTNDGSPSLFHDAKVVAIDSIKQSAELEKLPLIAVEDGETKSIKDESTPDFSGYKIIEEKAICIDESGVERCYGDSWVYASDPCKTCSCINSATVVCQQHTCDPYPDCPEGHFVVEVKTSKCIIS